jgi:hypothetical protein
MDWLSPVTALLAGAIAVPALVLLYFLKLKRRVVPVSSTLLWKRAAQDLRVNAPFQRLRRNLLLLLQLAALLALLVALGRPVLSLDMSPPRRLVILIDQSASMGATDVAPNRLAEAKAQARTAVDSLRTGATWHWGSRPDEAMVIAFAGRAKVMCNYTWDKAQLVAAIDAVEPTDGESRLAEAVTVARAYATPAGTQPGNSPGWVPEDKGRSAEEPARLELFSDGRIGDLDQVAVAPGELTFHAIGRSADNLALVAMQARRSFEQPEKLSVFADLANYGSAAVACRVQLSIDQNVRAVQAVTVPPRSPGRQGDAGKPGHTVVSFTLPHGGAGVLEARLLHEDALASDNAAWVVLAPPRPLAVALVTEGNPALRSALKSCGLARLDVMKPPAFDRFRGAQGDPAAHAAGAPEVPYDLVVLDGYAPETLPRGNYLIFGSPPPASGARVEGEVKDQWIIDWRSRHPVLNFVNLENVLAAKAFRLALPRDAAVLAEFADGPALVEVHRQGGVLLLASFDVLQSNWPFDAGFVMFCYNVLGYVSRESREGQSQALKVGQPITLQTSAGAKEASVTRPDGATLRLTHQPSGVLRYPATTRAGVYRVAVEGGPEHLFAVNLLDADESDLGPPRELVSAGQAVKAQEGGAARANQELWPLLALLGLAVVCIEWYVYRSKVRL